MRRPRYLLRSKKPDIGLRHRVAGDFKWTLTTNHQRIKCPYKPPIDNHDPLRMPHSHWCHFDQLPSVEIQPLPVKDTAIDQCIVFLLGPPLGARSEGGF